MLFVNRLKTNIFFVNVPLKLLLPESFSAQNALNIVWRPGSARTRWGSLQHSPDPLAGFKGPSSKGVEGRGTEGRREGKGRGEEGEFASS